MLILVRRYQSEMTNLLSPFGGNSNPFFFRQEEGSILGSINGVDHVHYDFLIIRHIPILRTV